MQHIDLTKKIISIPSYYDKNNNETVLGNFIFNYIKSNIPQLQVTKQFEKLGKRFNVIASNSNNPEIVFSSHIDTVQPVGCVKDQLNVRVEGDKLFGLGSSDMKGGLAAAISAIEDMRDNLPPMAIVFDYDEEYYFAGIINFLKSYNYRPRLAVFTEPTDMKILNGCRGITEVRFDVLGRTGHGSRPGQAINAIQSGCKLVQKLQSELKKENNIQIGINSINFSSIRGGRGQDGKIIEQANAVPDIARILLDIRISDKKINGAFIKNYLENLAEDLSVKISKFTLNLDVKPCLTDKSELSIVENAIKKVLGKVKYQSRLDTTGLFEGAFVKPAWNCPCFALGPGPRNTEFTKGEYVSIKDLKMTKQIYKELLSASITTANGREI